VEEHTLVH